ncbi:hypothetical protein AVEN_154866-1 [Araneus ventricosus]|uniref:Uncharacterized protein n=1 Tax=Araneus ventricosus TaxID=182803 RepID=A0A4Y2P3J7_ARAVE|nr:hypothetical protein AVEN_154866-1 [Araneus ventricosus]
MSSMFAFPPPFSREFEKNSTPLHILHGEKRLDFSPASTTGAISTTFVTHAGLLPLDMSTRFACSPPPSIFDRDRKNATLLYIRYGEKYEIIPQTHHWIDFDNFCFI